MFDIDDMFDLSDGVPLILDADETVTERQSGREDTLPFAPPPTSDDDDVVTLVFPRPPLCEPESVDEHW